MVRREGNMGKAVYQNLRIGILTICSISMVIMEQQ